MTTATASPQRLPMAAVLKRSWRIGRTRVGLVLTVAVLALALVGPAFAPHGPTEIVSTPFAKPGNGLPLGADYLGRDVLSRVLWGGRSVVWMATVAGTLGVAFGVLLGLVAGYSGGRADDLVMRSLDVLLAFPGLVFALLFISMLGPHEWLIVLVVAIGWVPGVARVARGITAEVASRDFVLAAEIVGAPRRKILRREILPHLALVGMVEYGLRLTWSIAAIAGLSFLGFGLQPPAADWGLMINENRSGLVTQPCATLIPVLCIAVLTVGVNLFTEGVARAVAGIDRAAPR